MGALSTLRITDEFMCITVGMIMTWWHIEVLEEELVPVLRCPTSTSVGLNRGLLGLKPMLEYLWYGGGGVRCWYAHICSACSQKQGHLTHSSLCSFITPSLPRNAHTPVQGRHLQLTACWPMRAITECWWRYTSSDFAPLIPNPSVKHSGNKLHAPPALTFERSKFGLSPSLQSGRSLALI